MSTITILGTGPVGRALAARWHRAGHRVTLGSRSPESVIDDPKVRVAEHATALEGAAVVVNALPGSVSVEVLGSLAYQLAGIVVADGSNGEPDAERGSVSIAEAPKPPCPARTWSKCSTPSLLH